MKKRCHRACLAAGHVLAASLLLSGQRGYGAEPSIQWGLSVTNINNPIPPVIVTNADSSISITAGGGDTYSAPDSFTYAYQQVRGDFDISVQVINVDATDVFGQDTPKGSLMMRASLAPAGLNIQLNATPPSPSNRNGQIESIGRLVATSDTDDLPGRLQRFGGDTTENDYCTYPNVWFRIQRQGQKVMTYFKSDNTTDFPVGWASNPGSTNGWQLLTVTMTGTAFPETVYIGLATVAHNSDITDTTHTVTATYANFGPTPNPPSNPSIDGVAAELTVRPGAFPNTKVLAANFDASVPADGMGYPPDIAQSEQGSPERIIWNSGGFGGVARDVIAGISGQTPGAFSFARYQAGAFDFLLNPRDPVAAQQHLGSYTNALRVRYGTGNSDVAASQAWAPSPNYGFVFTTVHKNGAVWNDGSPSFYAATYVQLDGVASARGYDMIGGHFRGAQFYTRTTKLVTGSPTDPASDLSNLQRCAIPISVAWFPYDQGWKAGYFDVPDAEDPTLSHWKRGDGWGLNSGTAVAGLALSGGQRNYNTPKDLLKWETTGAARLTLPGVNANNDGMLFTVGNDESGSRRGPSVNNAALPDGSGWTIAVRDIETSKADPTVYATGANNDAGKSFSFLYVPYDSVNLVGGHVGTNGTRIKGGGTFEITRLSAGRYALTIPGKTGADGVLLLQNVGYLATQPAGLTNVVDNSFLSYEYGVADAPAGSFVIESRYINASGGGDGVVSLRDAEFNFVFVDFNQPLSPPVAATGAPVLSIARTGSDVTVSWTNGAGLVLQSTTTLAPGNTWQTVGTANPSAPITIGASPMFFRVVSQ